MGEVWGFQSCLLLAHTDHRHTCQHAFYLCPLVCWSLCEDDNVLAPQTRPQSHRLALQSSQGSQGIRSEWMVLQLAMKIAKAMENATPTPDQAACLMHGSQDVKSKDQYPITGHVSP